MEAQWAKHLIHLHTCLVPVMPEPDYDNPRFFLQHNKDPVCESPQILCTSPLSGQACYAGRSCKAA